ncbi:MAG: hypothetical protein R3B07_29040 [Polyangiaceae bacterium]
MLSELIGKLELKYVVLSMVDRDDLLDGGAAWSAKPCVAAVLLELLVETWSATSRTHDTAYLVESGPDAFAHNIEVSRRLTPRIRDARRSYDQSLEVLRHEGLRAQRMTKSSIMVGIGD